MEGSEEYLLRRELLQDGRFEKASKSQTQSLSASQMVGIREAHEALSTGQETLRNLLEQGEILDRTDMVVDSHKNLIDQSRWHLRGMTFVGRFQNMFTKYPTPPTSGETQAAEKCPQSQITGNKWGNGLDTDCSKPVPQAQQQPLEGFLCPTCLKCFGSPSLLTAHFNHCGGAKDNTAPMLTDLVTREELFNNKRSIQTGAGLEQQRQRPAAPRAGPAADVPDEEFRSYHRRVQSYMDQLGPALDNLKTLSGQIGSVLDEQNNQIRTLKSKNEDLDQNTKIATRKAMQLKGSTKETYYNELAFQEVRSGRFLTVAGQEIVVAEPELRNTCRFSAYHKQRTVWGLKSAVTDFWVGVNMFGYLKVRGRRFREWEDLSLDPAAAAAAGTTKIFACAARGGRGGWLHVGAGGQVQIKDDSQASRDGAAVFRVINCSEYVLSPFSQDRIIQKRPLEQIR